jgi:dihydrofolate reductase
MNECPKIVLSRTLEKATWQNTRLLRGEAVELVRELKQEPGDDMAILGSGSLVAQLAGAGLLDEIQIALDPVVLGKGKSLFGGLASRLDFKLVKSRAFRNGSVVLNYAPAK